MSGRLREIARQTMAIAEAGSYLHPDRGPVDIAADVTAAIGGTRHFLPSDAISTSGARNATPLIEVTRESTLVAAHRLGENAATLVFASAKNPGGGVLGGAQAQEESLARSSALYPCLLTAADFYAFHRSQQDLRYSDRVIYSPKVPVFRDDKGSLLAETYRTTFLTAAAPNLGAILSNQPEHAPSVPDVLTTRATRVLEIAAAHGHRTLVLGAWGCGVFRNDPSTVARAFASALQTVDYFDHVAFAIYDRVSGTPVHAAFAAAFPAR